MKKKRALYDKLVELKAENRGDIFGPKYHKLDPKLDQIKTVELNIWNGCSHIMSVGKWIKMAQKCNTLFHKWCNNIHSLSTTQSIPFIMDLSPH